MSPRTRRRAVLALALLLIGAGSVWAYQMYRSSAHRARVEELREELRGEEGRKLTADERAEKWKELREEIDQLTPEQRLALEKDRRKKIQEKLAKYFSLPKDQRAAFLDAEIRNMEARRQKAAQGGGRSGNGQGRGGQGANGTGTGQGPGGPGGPGDRETRKKMFLDSTTPQERAQMVQYTGDLNVRRQQLGLPTFGSNRTASRGP